MPVRRERAPLASGPAGHGTALLIIDMISTWDFPDAERIAPGAARIAPRIAALKRRADRAGVPTVFVNDNHDRWRSEFREIVALAAGASVTGTRIAASLAPDDADYAVLKPKHSAFFATPLDLLLRHLQANRIVLTGVAAELCIVVSAADARMRDYDVVVPADCIASLSASRQRLALRTLGEVHGVATTPSSRIRFERR